MSRSIRRVVALAVGAALAAAPVSALADGDEAAAEALFEEAQKLVKDHKYAEACPKFAESNRLDRGAGTLIHLADCYEKNKQTASAWATYKDAASAAQALGRADWQKLATKRASALEPKLAKLTIKVSEPIDKLEVKKDGAPFSQASWGVPLPVDVGTHVIEANAPGHATFKTTATVAKDGDKIEVVVPKLEASKEAVATGPATPPPEVHEAPTSPAVHADAGGGSSQRTIGLVVGGVGIAALAAGGVTGLMAWGKNNDSKNACPNDGACASSDAVDANGQAKSLALVSTIAFGAGLAMVAGGAILFFTAPKGSSSKESARALHVTPTASPTGSGLAVWGSF